MFGSPPSHQSWSFRFSRRDGARKFHAMLHVHSRNTRYIFWNRKILSPTEKYISIKVSYRVSLSTPTLTINTYILATLMCSPAKGGHCAPSRWYRRISRTFHFGHFLREYDRASEYLFASWEKRGASLPSVPSAWFASTKDRVSLS